MKNAGAWVMWAVSTAALATEPLGPVYPVIEPDLLAILTQHVRDESAGVRQRQREAEAALRRYAERPTAVAGLTKAAVDRAWRYETPATDDRLIGDDFLREWLLIDADDPEQLALARRFMRGHTVATHRIVLVAGSLKAVREALGVRVWFDQAGRLTERFAIKAVPAHVRATKRAIVCREIAL